jgi:hypothetical protein
VSSWPKLADVRSWLRLQPDAAEDAIIDTARLAAIGYGVTRTADQWPSDSTDVPDLAVQACTMHAARLYRRRDSIDGTIGFGDMGVVRTGKYDPEIEGLYAQAMNTVVFG